MPTGNPFSSGISTLKNIAYRDLKPENVMLDADGHVQLADLGLCQEIDRNGKKLKQHCGTRAYMAPEQTYGEEGYSLEVDWWAFGVTILFMLTDKNPFYRKRRKKSERSRKKSGGRSFGTKKTLKTTKSMKHSNSSRPSGWRTLFKTKK
eukprot:TRINITY_DN12080_c0_g2_i1.p1 TRINITY_DN12080_c0_g2~~TRINITY_DN12080_c0_g2_i1.p1  ORF type:complete len:173 (+),score=49.29 TRINITY_DN12080_c0_g2_i1:73-519(+)